MYLIRPDQTEGIFNEYIDTLYNIKKSDANPLRRNTAKLLLNSLYGRMAMHDIISKVSISAKG